MAQLSTLDGKRMSPFIPNKSVMLTKEQEDSWSYVIGGLFLNFGGVEFIAFRWIEHLSQDAAFAQSSIDFLLGKKLATIRKLIASSSLSDDLRARATELWREIEEHAELRNALAHNPFVSGLNTSGNPVSGIMDMRRTKGSGQREVRLIQPAEIYKTSLRVAHLSNELGVFLAQAHINQAGTQ